MSQFNQIRERFIAKARQHLLDSDATIALRHTACGQNTCASRPIETSSRSGKTEA